MPVPLRAPAYKYSIWPISSTDRVALSEGVDRGSIPRWGGNTPLFSDINIMNIFSGQSPKAIEIRAKINPWDLIKLKSFCTAKETQKKTKRQLTEWEKIVSNDATDKGLISRIYKQLIQPNSKKANQSMEK